MNTHHTTTPEMQKCIEDCKQCHDICLQTAMTHCLPMGGRHVEQEHLRLMMNCAEICQTAANFMLSDSSLHGAVCTACAEVCDACADSCEQLDDMDACAQACRHCAESCEAMGTRPHPNQLSGGIQPSSHFARPDV